MEKTDIAKAKAIAFIKNNMLLTFGFKLKKKEKKHEEN